MNRRNFFALIASAFLGRIPEEKGLSIRCIRTYDPVRDVFINRMDVMYGIASVFTETTERTLLSTLA